MRKLEKLNQGISVENSPYRSMEKLRNIYFTDEKLTKYFSKYRDKGSGAKNYHDWLSAKQTYLNANEKLGRTDRETREREGVRAVESVILSNEEVRKKYWGRDDWMVYIAWIEARLDLSYKGFLKNPW